MVYLALTVAIFVLALLAFRWFERYRYTDAWREGELRAAAFSFLLWFGGLFGHRVPPPPQVKVEHATGAKDASDRPETPASRQDPLG